MKLLSPVRDDDPRIPPVHLAPRRLARQLAFTIRWICLLAVLSGTLNQAHAEPPRTLTASPRHLRNIGEREWDTFPEIAGGRQLTQTFQSTANNGEVTLRVQQRDIKQDWRVLLNDQPLGKLVRDENPMVVHFAVPPDRLRDGDNQLVIESSSDRPDDIEVGPITLISQPPAELLRQAELQVRILDSSSGRTIPGRITILTADGVLQELGNQSTESMAVRPGVVYCLGQARLQLPSGEFTIHAGRGLEWSVATARVELKADSLTMLDLVITREVDTSGWVACDTHVHTLTHSGHGDATIEERMLTLAGEGIEFPIATDHNKHIDYRPVSERLGTSSYFTPVVGNEFTTRLGHFNIFPISPDAAVADQTRTTWDELFEQIHETPGVEIIILNHPRDVHSGFRPFGPAHHLAIAGRNLDGWTLKANAMEVVNSAAQQTDINRLLADWMALLNSGHRITPVGCSDSHDVARHFVGQGRTYIRMDDTDPGHLDREAAIASLRAGKVHVSCGLLIDLQVCPVRSPNHSRGPGELVSTRDRSVEAIITVSGPSWTEGVSEIELYQNGRLIRSVDVSATRRITGRPEATGGILARRTFTLRDLPHDVTLIAVARGPAVKDLFWPIAKPYQPTATHWDAQAIAVSGAVYVDGDGDASFQSAAELAGQIIDSLDSRSTEPDAALIGKLSGLDESVSIQAAWLWHAAGHDLSSDAIQAALKRSDDQTVRAGFQKVRDGLREHARAKLEQQP